VGSAPNAITLAKHANDCLIVLIALPFLRKRGFNDMPLVDPLSPALITVRVRYIRAGAEPAEIVYDMVEGMGAQAVPH
jgi:hypothetical protein